MYMIYYLISLINKSYFYIKIKKHINQNINSVE